MGGPDGAGKRETPWAPVPSLALPVLSYRHFMYPRCAIRAGAQALDGGDAGIRTAGLPDSFSQTPPLLFQPGKGETACTGPLKAVADPGSASSAFFQASSLTCLSSSLPQVTVLKEQNTKPLSVMYT